MVVDALALYVLAVTAAMVFQQLNGGARVDARADGIESLCFLGSAG